jgi:spermidine synthase
VAVVSGFAVLALEVLYLRLFSLILHNSSYSFAAVVAVFLLALAAGAALAGALILRMEPRGLASASLVFGGVATAVSLAAFVHWSGLSYFQSTGGLRSYLWGSALLAGGVMLPPITLLGMTLPAAWRDAARSMPAGTAGHAATIGRLSLINTLAAAGGSLAASFVLLPGIGLHRSFVCIVGLVGLTGMVRLAWSGRSRAAIAAGLITAATATQMFLTPLESQISLRSEDEVLVRRWETAYGWIDVVRDGRRGSLDIRQNLNYRYGSTGDDAQREMRQAHLPLLLHPQPHDVLFLGLGTGVTAAGALAHPEVQHVTVVELIPEVVAAARLLADGNQHVVDDPRVRVEVDDARHFLLASPQSYDVVVGDLFVPWESETGYLYTREHFERVRSRLRPGGVCCQWLALYQLGPHEFELIADTFASVFPETTLWWGYLNPRRPMVALVGSAGPLPWKPTAIDARCAHLSTDSRPVDDSLSTSDRLLDALIGTWPNRPGALLNTVDRPRVEFSTPWSQQSGRLLRNINLERYFVGVLRRLPPPLGEIRQAVDASKSERIRANQRYVLFGE